MAPPGGRDAASLKDLLFEKTSRFEFLQAVRLLRKIWPERRSVGYDVDPRTEVVRFRSDVSAVFPTGDVKEAVPPEAGLPARLTVNFLGVATPGSWGALPRRYAEEVRYQVRNKRPAMRDFFDLFNHRLVSLFFRVGERTHPVLAYESGRDNPFERALLSILGLGTPGLQGRLPFDERMLIARGGLLSMRPMPVAGIEGLIRSVFAQPVEIQQFVPEHYGIETDDQNRLGLASSRLGDDLYLGERITLIQSKFRVCMGPLDREAYDDFLPDRPGFRCLADLVRFSVGEDLDFDIQLSLLPEEVMPVRLGEPEQGSARLGWTSWLAIEPFEEPPHDALFDPDNTYADRGPAPAGAYEPSSMEATP